MSPFPHAFRGLAACCFVWLLVASAPARAHEAPETSATITLRENDVDLFVDVDVARFLGAGVHGASRAALVDPSLATPDALLGVVEEANREVLATRLELDGRPVELRLVRGFTLDDVLGLLAGAGSDVHPRARLALRAGLPAPTGGAPRRGSGTVASLVLPHAFGPSIVNLVRPDTRWVAAGARGVLRLDAPAPTLAPRRGLPNVVAVASTVLALALLAARALRRPQGPRRNRPAASA